MQNIPDAHKYVITLYGSLAATGKGHLTGVAIEETFANKNMELLWEPTTFLPKHPNALKFDAFDREGSLQSSWTAYSIGGGAIADDTSERTSESIYPLTTMKEILEWSEKNGKQLWEYVELHERKEIWIFLDANS